MSLLQFGFTRSNLSIEFNSASDFSESLCYDSDEKDRVQVFLPAWKNNREWLQYIEEEKIILQFATVS